LVPPRQFIRTSGGSWALPGAVFSGLGGILGGLGGVLGPLEGVLVSWGRLESFVGRLGASWGRLGGQHGSNLAPKTEPKSNKNRNQNQSIFESLLGLDFYWIFVDFGGKMEASWHPDDIKNRCQLRKMIF